MMSEKRFVCIDIGYGDDWYITDNGERLSEMEIVDLLNEQQATIQSLQTELELVSGAKLFSRRELERKVKEQEATIRKLQDLCGQSDYENAKLRIENKSLQSEIKLLKPTNLEQYEQIVQLQKENEQLKEELNNLKKDETMLYHYYTLARYGGDGV